MSRDAFSDPATRMLLSADGSTTRLLEAVAGPLRLRVLHQAIGTAAAVPEPIRAALRLDAEAQIINRCSALMDGRLQPVSLNHVVAPYAPATQLGRIASGTDSGIGPELSASASSTAANCSRAGSPAGRTVRPGSSRR